jgi:deazaflavin-dependent oxidoreductase (nitroreductase family)
VGDTEVGAVALDVDGVVGRTLQRMAGSAAFARVGPRIVPPVDRALHRLTKGRVLSSRLLVPSLVLTTTGRRSGQRREVPLACLPEPDGSFLVVGSNFGREHHPAWTSNLLDQPAAQVAWRRRVVPVEAHLLDDAEKAAVWPRLVQVWPTYDRYVERSGRNLRVFRLVPTT